MPRLASEIDFAGFSHEARGLLAQQVPPEQVQWETVHTLSDDLYAMPLDRADHGARHLPRAAAAIVPASFLRMCEVVVLHRDPQRFALLYRLLWRLVHEPGLRNDPVDPEMLHAQQMAQAVRRDMHKMKAFVRFQPVPHPEHLGEMLHLAWYEPAHHIVEAVAPWFARRYAALHWALFTPERSVRWDGQQLLFAPGSPRERAPGPDAPGSEWLRLHGSVFHPRPGSPEGPPGATATAAPPDGA